MKVIVTRAYYCRFDQVKYAVGKHLELSEERAQQLIKGGFVKPIGEKAEKPAATEKVEVKPKKEKHERK